MKMKRLLISIGGAVTVIAVILVAAYFFTRPTYVFSVNGICVEQEELLYIMDLEKSNVAAVFEEKMGEDVGQDGFWDKIYENKTPADTLRKTAADEIIRQKVQLQQAKKLDNSIRLYYSEYETQRQSENEKRQTDNGEVSYGPDELSYHFFYTGKFMAAQKQLREHWEATAPAIDDRAIFAYYQAHKAQYRTDSGAILPLENCRDGVRNALLSKAYEAYVDTLVQKAEVVYYTKFSTCFPK